MMGRKQQLKDGLEYDVVFGRGVYCYLVNHHNIVKWVKRKMNKRLRRKYKKELNEYSIGGMG
jgi:hypothetical protein